MSIRTVRHFVLYFAVGLSWGFMAKTFASTYLYIGYDDPQVTESLDAYEIERLLGEGRDFGDSFLPDQTSVEEGQANEVDEVEITPQGTVSI